MILTGFEVSHINDAPPKRVNDKITMIPLREGGKDELSVMRLVLQSGAVFGEELHQRREILYVEEGIFHDGEIDHPAGTLIVAQPGSTHWPSSPSGCTLLVFYPEGLGS
jgi:anti-sigma factor ChrR (cupin superfamily)